jgi:hypothetical protein
VRSLWFDTPAFATGIKILVAGTLEFQMARDPANWSRRWRQIVNTPPVHTCFILALPASEAA